LYIPSATTEIPGESTDLNRTEDIDLVENCERGLFDKGTKEAVPGTCGEHVL
jgi:hypothetical protein